MRALPNAMKVLFALPGACRRVAGAWVLLAHAALLAVGPPPVVFLANHDHVVIGSVTAEQWRAHVQFHLQQSGSHYLSVGVSGAPVSPHQPRITSLPGCGYDALGVSARAMAAAPVFHAIGDPPLCRCMSLAHQASVIDLSPRLAPDCPPPRPAARRQIC